MNLDRKKAIRFMSKKESSGVCLPTIYLFNKYSLSSYVPRTMLDSGDGVMNY